MEQLSAPLVSSNDVDGGGGGGGGVRNHVVKPVIPPKPEGYGTLGRSSSRDHHKSENGSAEQNRLSYSSQRPKSTEMLTEFQISSAAAANPPAGGASSNCSSSSNSTTNPATRQSPRSPRSKPPAPPVPNSPRPLPHQFSLADGQGSVLADLTLDCPCPLLTQQGGGSGGGSTIHGGGSKHQSAYEPQLSVWNPLIEPPQLFQSAMDLDLTSDFGNIDSVDPIPPPAPIQEHQHQPVPIIKPAPPPPLSSMSFQPSLYPEPMKPTKVDPPRLPAVPPVSSSLSLNLSMDPLSRPMSKIVSTNDTIKPVLPISNELNKLFKPESNASGNSQLLSSSSAISAPPSVHSTVQRVEPRVTTDLVKLENIAPRPAAVVDPPATQQSEPATKPSRVLPLKPFPESSSSQPKSAGQSLESIQSNPSTIDTTDSPHSIQPMLAPNESISARNALNSELHRAQQPNGRPSTESSAETVKPTAAAAPLSPPLLLPAPHPPPPPPPSSYMTIDIDPSGTAAASAASQSAGSGDSGGEKVVDFYPPNSFRPYSFHSECWRKEIPENETKWQMYKRRFSEFVFNFVACCIRCIGPVWSTLSLFLTIELFYFYLKLRRLCARANIFDRLPLCLSNNLIDAIFRPRGRECGVAFFSPLFHLCFPFLFFLFAAPLDEIR